MTASTSGKRASPGASTTSFRLPDEQLSQTLLLAEPDAWTAGWHRPDPLGGRAGHCGSVMDDSRHVAADEGQGMHSR